MIEYSTPNTTVTYADDINQTSTGVDFNVVMTVSVVAMLIFGIVTAFVAKHNERSVIPAFFSGFFLGPIGLASYMIMGESIELRVYLEQKALIKLKKSDK